MRPTLVVCSLLAAALLALSGCQSGGPRFAGLNPFYRQDRTTFETPPERIVAIRRVASRSTGEDTPEQQAIVQELVGALAAENDPLIRQATLETAAEFNTPLASQALLAGLSDEDPHVRIAACQMLGDRRVSQAAEALSARVQGDDSIDVRLAAARALGQVGASKQQLLPVLQDSDPAMQLVGVEAMRRMTGQDFGGDVAAYVALARGETPTPANERRTAVANRLPDWVPFF